MKVFNKLKSLLKKNKVIYTSYTAITIKKKQYLINKIYSKTSLLSHRYKSNPKTKPLKVLYLVVHESVWKYQKVFELLDKDACFEQLILIVPYINSNFKKEQMDIDMERTFHYFKEKKYPVIKAKNDSGWFDIENDLQPDIVIFTNPHKLTMNQYYNDIFGKYISYFVPYDHQISKYDNYQGQYNQLFHNAMWRIFSPHNVAYDIHKQYSDNKGKNVLVTGYPAMEPFMDANYMPANPWKSQDKQKLKIIWAPHHTIDSPELPYANFLKYAEFFKTLVEKYQDSIQWAFKPHPILKPKLINHPDWGKDKTEDFWAFWQDKSNCQLEEGEYVDLFLKSDAMIHDSGSFLAEYLYTDNPVLYLTSSSNMKDYFNPFGCEAFDACYHAFSEQDIEEFIHNLSDRNDSMKPARKAFLDKHVTPFFQDKMPSDRIIESIRKDFGIEQ